AAVAAVRRAVAERARYLTHGIGLVYREESQLETRFVELDSLRRRLDALDQRLKSVRDQAIRHVSVRALQVLDRSADQVRWMQAMRHFNIDGPTPKRPLDVPSGY